MRVENTCTVLMVQFKLQKVKDVTEIDRKDWFVVGEEIGLEVIEDDIVEEEVDEQDIADSEVNAIFQSNKQKHEKLLRGMYVSREGRD